MKIGRILYPITTLGPGNRLVVWTCGCTKRCENCISPEWWDAGDKNYYEMSAARLGDVMLRLIETYHPDGITVSGGDPLEQADELLPALEMIRPVCGDILVYTGYRLDELKALWPPAMLNQLMANVSVLIDGRYIDELNDNLSPLRGSANQIIHYFDEPARYKYERYMKENGRAIQPVQIDDQQIYVGILNREGA